MKLPKAETLILLAFLVCAALWGRSKCNNQRSDAARRVREVESSDAEPRPEKRDTVVLPPAPQTPTNPQTLTPAEALAKEGEPPNSQATPNTPQPGAAPKRPQLSNQSGAAQNPVGANGATLYATIDGLKVRKEPGLKGETVAELKLYEPVIFLNKKTEWTQEISLGYEKVTDHWVKVRTQSGKEGWVFGAGVHYYKTKRHGVMEDKKPQDEAKKKKNR